MSLNNKSCASNPKFCRVVHPMHPQYTDGQACVGDEVGCGTGSSWSDTYDTDDYEYLGDGSFYDAPRNPNVKFAGICNGSLACGSAKNEINVFLMKEYQSAVF